MKKYFIGIFSFLLIFIMIGCKQLPNTETVTVETPTVEDIPEYIFDIEATLNEYMFYRTQAVLKNDINILWSKYPNLKNFIDEEKAINVEKLDLDLNKETKIIDANYDLEKYDQIKVKEIDDTKATVQVHGLLLYMKEDFNETGGEFLMDVFLEKKEGKWTVVKVDEYNIEEYKQWAKKNN